mmetsp:Transcript_26627/g.79969  ORF Transcript_26627/g.79969 Transcript_26627/m.79969 type:complete len:85 (+) Transcript_26627:2952-3206(+)
MGVTPLPSPSTSLLPECPEKSKSRSLDVSVLVAPGAPATAASLASIDVPGAALDSPPATDESELDPNAGAARSFPARWLRRRWL